MSKRSWLLDLTRLGSRQGKDVLTGIDRVEKAWAERLLLEEGPVYGLVRSRSGYLLLDRDGIGRVIDAAGRGRIDFRSDWLSWLRFGADSQAARAESQIRRWAVQRLARPFLARRLRQLFPDGGTYLNLGHSNLTNSGLRDIGAAGFFRAIMVHDVIPILGPQWARTGTVPGFVAKMQAVSAQADLLIHLTEDSRRATEACLTAQGRLPRGVTAPLGVPLVSPDDGYPLPLTPYFLTIGTLEPRKNLGLLLDVWSRLPMDHDWMPLVVAGTVGWEQPEVLTRLGQMVDQGRVLHFDALPDGALVKLLQSATALLFPSLAEGFGLPPVEAAKRGIPVVVSNLPVFREVLGDYPIYLSPSDIYSWMETVRTLSIGVKTKKGVAIPKKRPLVGYTWDAHFNQVLGQLG